MNRISACVVFVIYALFSLLSCAESSRNSSRSAADSLGTSNWLIIPGKAIGHIRVNTDADSLRRVLGSPVSSDAGMGSAVLRWTGKDEQDKWILSVFVQHNMGMADEHVARIKKAMVTSPKFATIEGISVGQSLKAIGRSFSLRQTGSYKQFLIYSDISRGISFDIDSLSDKCLAITVFKPGDSLMSTINMRE